MKQVKIRVGLVLPVTVEMWVDVDEEAEEEFDSTTVVSAQVIGGAFTGREVYEHSNDDDMEEIERLAIAAAKGSP